MTHAAHHNEFARYAGDNVASQRNPVAKRPGILRRVFNAMIESRQRQTNRQIAHYLAQSGGRFSDEVERDLMRRVSTSNWNVHR